MLLQSKTAQRWIEPLLALGVGESVAVRFFSAEAAVNTDLGIVAPGADTFTDYPAPSWYVRELSAQELELLAGQYRVGTREVLLSEAFASGVAAAQGAGNSRQMFEAAAGLLIGGHICRIAGIKPLDSGGATYAWQLLCDAPVEAT
jgi:hypothetical protein